MFFGRAEGVRWLVAGLVRLVWVYEAKVGVTSGDTAIWDNVRYCTK